MYLQSPVREALSTSNVATLLKHHRLTSLPIFVQPAAGLCRWLTQCDRRNQQPHRLRVTKTRTLQQLWLMRCAMSCANCGSSYLSPLGASPRWPG